MRNHTVRKKLKLIIFRQPDCSVVCLHFRLHRYSGRPLSFLPSTVIFFLEMSQGATADIEVSLNDKRTEDYVAPPPPAYVAFSKGNALGSSSAGLLNSFCPINL